MIALYNEDSYWRPAHSALTKFMKRKWSAGMGEQVKHILERCDVSPYVGQLPPQLCALVNRRGIKTVTHVFRVALHRFLTYSKSEIRAAKSGQKFQIPGMERYFGKCELEIEYYSTTEYYTLCKLSFPEHNLHYSLKLFNVPVPEYNQSIRGKFVEVANAFAASYGEPKDNSAVYMASLAGRASYLLPEYTDEKNISSVRWTNKYKIFGTHRSLGAFCGGRRIDYLGSHKTQYGKLSYPERKMYRKIINAFQADDSNAMQDMRDKSKNMIYQRQLEKAITCVKNDANNTYNRRLREFVSAKTK